jgi:hypothetical protein
MSGGLRRVGSPTSTSPQLARALCDVYVRAAVLLVDIVCARAYIALNAANGALNASGQLRRVNSPTQMFGSAPLLPTSPALPLVPASLPGDRDALRRSTSMPAVALSVAAPDIDAITDGVAAMASVSTSPRDLDASTRKAM